MKRIFSILVAACLIFSIIPATSLGFSGEVNVGTGSYSTIKPQGVNDVQSTIYKTSNFTGKMPTNDWWSSTAWVQYSERQYPHPLAVQNQANGLRVYYPGPTITGNSACVCAWMPATTDPNGNDDFIIGHTATSSFLDTKVDGASDWFVTNVSANGSNSLKVSYGHGSPYIYATYAGGDPKISFPSVPTIWSGNSTSPVLGITINGRHYGLFAPSGSTWSGIGTATLTNSMNGKNYFSIAVLPDNSSTTLTKFNQYAYAHVTDTKVTWSYNAANSEVTTTYNYTTTAREGTQSGTIFALYPHQWKNSTKSLLNYSYSSVRGTMKVAEGSSYQTKMKFNGVLPSLPDLGSYNKSTLAGYVNEAANETYTGFPDTYWYGKRLGKLATLAPIADQAGNTSAANQFRNEIKSGLEKWFKASDATGNLKTSEVFYYNSNWGTLLGYPDSFGSVEELNDHHFHYGYFIKAAAEIARVDKTWANDSNWGQMVKLLIRDFASSDRNDSMFPFLRNFDIYAGHTWASGHAKFGDGNNNESSSEAMNAWTGLILWGEATGDTTLRDLGIYLYTTEMNAINEYWFDVTDQNHHPDFTRATASMIWGGKTVGDGVWWTANPEEVHGINWLPFQGGSLYLTQYPAYTKKNYDALVNENGGTNWDVWADLIWMYRAIHDPVDAINQFNTGIGTLTPEAGNSKANTYHWIHNLNAVGTADLSVTADYPVYAVFNKGGTRTYVVYNMTNSERTVHFSDGATVTAAPNSFNIGNGSGGTSDTEAPTAPSNLTSPSHTDTTVDLSWTASTDNVGVTGYDVYNGSTFVDTTTSTSYTVTGLTAESTYTFTVKAKDAAGNVSAASNSVTVTTNSSSGGGGDQHVTADYTAGITETTATQAKIYFTPTTPALYVDVHYTVNSGGQLNYRMTNNVGTWEHFVDNLNAGNVIDYWFTYEKNGPQFDSVHYSYTFASEGGTTDTQAPTAPGNLTSTGKTETTVELSWSASTDNIGVTGYEIYNGGALAGTTTSTAFTVTGLTAGTTYTFTVKAKDAAGNRSAASNSVTVTTNTPPNEHVTADYTAGVTKLNATQAKIYFTPTTPALYVDVHYTVNSGGQLNYRMTNNNGTWEQTVSNLNAGDVITYWFTYEKNGPQFDTVQYMYTQ